MQLIKNCLKLDPYIEGQFHQGPILIIISGVFSSKYTFDKDWKKFIDVYQTKFKEPIIIYHYLWPASHLNIGNLLSFKNNYMTTKKKAKFCGKLLALMILSNEFFSGFKINLAGFDLGCHVIKYCIRELGNYERLDIINNIIFFGGSTNINNNLKWEQILNSFNGIIINCYSSNDLFLHRINLITNKQTIGTRELKINNLKIKNISVNTFHCTYGISLNIIGELFIDDLIE